MDAEQYVIYPGETSKVTIEPTFPAEKVTINGASLAVSYTHLDVYKRQASDCPTFPKNISASPILPVHTLRALSCVPSILPITSKKKWISARCV